MITEDKEKSLLFFDEGFPDRVLKTSFFLSLLLVVCSLSYMSFMVTVSVAVGCFISLILCKVLWWTIQHMTQHVIHRERSRIKKFLLKINILKYFILGALLLSISLFLDVDVIAMMIGLSVVIAVIVMKIGSKVLVNYMNRLVKVPYKDINL
ncbi:MAG: hypothetical protein QY310_14005 [Candidatus Jettenia sp. CY-1]|nr:hypothetical protein [Candidatus Jettenia sp.]WKZ18525.1 MAG: hypothetical protein QY310_14005 [Candidatus Jettenia sp. CY-1]